MFVGQVAYGVRWHKHAVTYLDVAWDVLSTRETHKHEHFYMRPV